MCDGVGCRVTTGAPMAGTPEISLMIFMIGQMARYYDVPWRTSNTLGGAKTFDAQARYESTTTLMAVMLSGANYLWHSAGWNEAGMHCSMAKFVVDAEQCVMAYRMSEGVQWADFDEALLDYTKPIRLPPNSISRIGANAILRWGEWRAGREL